MPRCNWDTVKSLDCIVCCILEWAQSIPMDKWSLDPPGLEYRVAVSEWLLHSSKDDYDYLFSPSDKDSHTSLLIHLNPRHFSSSDIRAQKRSETKMDSNVRRKEGQKIDKAKGSGGATSGTTGTTSTAPPPTSGTTASATAPPRTTSGRPSSAAPTTLPKASGTTAPVTPPKAAPTFDKGRSSAKGKSKTSDDAGNGTR